MKRELALEFSRVTEAAALACHSQIGRGDKNAADDLAVSAMRQMLNNIDFSGEIVIGEGEIDEAPMLYIGEKVGLGGEEWDIAVDPIDGTRMVALGQDNAVAVMVLAKRDSLLKAPDMYMEKIIVSSSGAGSVSLNNTIEENIINLSKKLNKEVKNLCIMTLAKPRHEETIKIIQQMGAKVIAIPDGDVEGSVLVAMPDSEVDMFYGIGGAPEGVISAAIMRAMGGDMEARLLTRSHSKGSTIENDALSLMELSKLEDLGLEEGAILTRNQLSSSDKLIVSMTGITNGSLLKGTTINGNLGTTETLLIRGTSRTVRKIQSTHYLDRKDEKVQSIINKD